MLRLFFFSFFFLMLRLLTPGSSEHLPEVQNWRFQDQERLSWTQRLEGNKRLEAIVDVTSSQTNQETILFALLTKATWSINWNWAVRARIAGWHKRELINSVLCGNLKLPRLCTACCSLKKGSSFLGCNVKTMVSILSNLMKPLKKDLFPIITVQYKFNVVHIFKKKQLTLSLGLLWSIGYYLQKVKTD